MNISKYKVPVNKLRWSCNPKQFDFSDTKDMLPLEGFIGQDRAVQALEFGLEMTRPGYNIYVAGLTGTGKTAMTRAYIEKVIKTADIVSKPDDWCYLYNFNDPDRPQVVSLPQGNGKAFRKRILKLLEDLKKELSKAFTSEEYEEQRKSLIEDTQAGQKLIFDKVSKTAREKGFTLQPSATGAVLIPMAEDKPMSQEEYLQLDDEVKKRIEENRSEVMKLVESNFEKARDLEQDSIQKLQEMDKRIGEFTISKLFKNLTNEYKANAIASQYLNGLQSYTLDHLEVFKQAETAAPAAMLIQGSQNMSGAADPLLPFQVNVFVDNSKTSGPPVIVETNPTYGNMFGKTERKFFMGAYLIDHTMLKPGALHLANGGYLLINVRDVLTNPFVWETLKRAIKNEEVRIDDPFEQFGLISPIGLKPQAMPVNVKVILTGDAFLYQMLSQHDEEFWEIFKVKADFDYQVDRSKENMDAYAGFIATCCQKEGIRHFNRSAIAKVIEFGARMVADQDKLLSRFSVIRELLEEADYWAGKAGSKLISGQHIQQAIDARTYRHNLLDHRIRDMITRGTIMIDVEGRVVGQVNGLSVYSLGDISFGKPSRITAKTYMGRGGVINIEREVQLSGPIHNKGVFILSGYLGWKFAQDRPLSLSASICFEQSYDGVEGDSASSTELYAILSSLSELPLNQGIAVTGSVNQKGELQPIGGANQKIEGFFQICKAMGLNNEQGVLIPSSNLKNLMLREEVVDAVRKGQFHIYAAYTIDEGIEILTGVKAGKRRANGTYTSGTVNDLVDKRLKRIAEGLKGFSSENNEKGKTKNSKDKAK